MVRTREEILQSYTSDDDRLLAAKTLDKLNIAERTWELVRGDFYDPAQMRLIKDLTIRRGGGAKATFYGAYSYAERERACFVHEDMGVEPEDFCLAVLRVTGNFSFLEVSHRDFMGALLNLGLRREKLGDVVAEDDGAFLVVDDQVADHVRTQLEHVGKAPVNVDYSTFDELAKWQPRYQSSVSIAASARLDAVTAAAYNLSRSEAATLVERGHVKLNHVPCTSGSKDIKPGDLLSARGYGRAYVREFIGLTQKDRLRLRVERPL